jgi:RNA polymerase sigma factor (sigma-70 family)
MASAQATLVLRHLRQLMTATGSEQLLDRQLLDRFTSQREEAAFTALVRRHGPLVLGVCRRILPNGQDAEDAFQATFLTLARRAGSVGRQGSLSGWLYQVAYHTAVRLRASAATRVARERHVIPRLPGDPLSEVTGRELLTVLDAELQQLPERYRTPLVLCHLEGKTRDEAAQQLGCSVSTLKRRLAEGQDRLRRRLTRRGLTLSAALLATGLAQSTATATVPALLASATSKVAMGVSAGKALSSLVSVRVAALSQGSGTTLAMSKLKVVTGIVLALSLIGTSAGWLTHRAQAQKPAELAADDLKGKPSVPLPKEDQKYPPSQEPTQSLADAPITIEGKVVDPDGKPVAGAAVALLRKLPPPPRGQDVPFLHLPEDLLGQTTTDQDGRYSWTLSQADLKKMRETTELTVLAGAKNFGLGWQSAAVKPNQDPVVVRLSPEQPVRGRLVDLQGQPTAGVKVHVLSVDKDGAERLELSEPASGLPGWPEPVVTDEEGRFVLHGLNQQMSVTVRIHDERFALHDLVLNGDAVTLPLAPPRIIEGRVVYADTGNPVANLVVYALAHDDGLIRPRSLSTRTDEEGRYRFNHYSAGNFHFATEDRAGEPYFAINSQLLDWPKGKVKQTVQLALPRGISQKGKVVDGVTGQPVADAEVLYIPQLHDNPLLKGEPYAVWQGQIGRARSGPDGTFQVPVLAGPGHLQVRGPWGQEYAPHALPYKELFGQEGGHDWYAHDWIELDVKPEIQPEVVTAKLHPAVRIRGRLVDPDGHPVAQAWMSILSSSDPRHLQSQVEPLEVKDGQFELVGVNPTESYRVLFLDKKNHRGTLATIAGKQPEGQPVTVRLEACGTATMRFVDADGKPLEKLSPQVWVQGTSMRLANGGFLNARNAVRLSVVMAGVNTDAPSDAQGRYTLADLVPGVQYVVYPPHTGPSLTFSLEYTILDNRDAGFGGSMMMTAISKESKEFKVEAGKTLDLGDIHVDPSK